MRINVKSSGGLVSRWFGSLNVLAIKSKLRLARSSANWRKVLAIGEEILAKAPDDADTHIEMAAAAKELGAPQLAFWLLERGREQAPDNASLLKAIAQYHEDLEQWTAAASAWEKVKELDPSDSKASHKINDLLAKSHLAHGRRRR